MLLAIMIMQMPYQVSTSTVVVTRHLSPSLTICPPPSMKIALPLKIIIADICLLVRVRVMAIRFR